MKRKRQKKDNRKLLILILIIFLIALFIGSLAKASEKEAATQKKNLLCDKLVDCITPVQHKIPKGICVPGGKCT